MLSDEERALYAWQLDVPGLGEEGQRRLRDSSVLVSRTGGLGGPLAFALAAAGVGRIVLAHAGDLRPDDLNRQILMTHDGLGKPRAEQAAATLRRFNPAVEVAFIPENPAAETADEWVEQVDVVFGCAPLFEERFALNDAAVAAGKPYIDAAMYGMEGSVLLVAPGKGPCLRCLVPELPPFWKRRFPVIGAVSAMIAQMAVLEWIKWTCNMPSAQSGVLFQVDTTAMSIEQVKVARRTDCPVCCGVS